MPRHPLEKPTHCKKGHLRSPENTSSRGSCLTCEATAAQSKRDAIKNGTWKPRSAYPKGFCLRGHPRVPENLYPTGQCKICGREDSLKRYYADPEKAKKAARANVLKDKDYVMQRQNEWQRRNPEKVRTARIKHKYGLDAEEYRTRFSAQEEKCSICRVELVDPRNTVVDHDHACCGDSTSCGKCVRGILCRTCNIGLGGFADSVDNLQKAILYLQAYTETRTNTNGS